MSAQHPQSNVTIEAKGDSTVIDPYTQFFKGAPAVE